MTSQMQLPDGTFADVVTADEYANIQLRRARRDARRKSRANETPEQRDARLAADRAARLAETPEERDARLAAQRERVRAHRARKRGTSIMPGTRPDPGAPMVLPPQVTPAARLERLRAAHDTFLSELTAKVQGQRPNMAGVIVPRQEMKALLVAIAELLK